MKNILEVFKEFPTGTQVGWEVTNDKVIFYVKESGHWRKISEAPNDGAWIEVLNPEGTSSGSDSDGTWSDARPQNCSEIFVGISVITP